MKINLLEDWAEIVALILLIIGFAAALYARSAVLGYIIIFLFGLIFGRAVYRFKRKLKVPLFLAIAGFLAGFLLGSLYTDSRTALILFAIGATASYLLHDKRIIHSAEY